MKYTHKTYGTAQGFVQDDDGTVREMTPEELAVYSARMRETLERSMLPDAVDPEAEKKDGET